MRSNHLALTPGPLQKQQVILATKPFPQLPYYSFTLEFLQKQNHQLDVTGMKTLKHHAVDPRIFCRQASSVTGWTWQPTDPLTMWGSHKLLITNKNGARFDDQVPTSSISDIIWCQSGTMNESYIDAPNIEPKFCTNNYVNEDMSTTIIDSSQKAMSQKQERQGKIYFRLKT